MPVFNNVLAGSSGQGTGYNIDQSVRFNNGDSAYLNRTAGTATSNDIGTLSFWTKRGVVSGGRAFFSNHADANNRTFVGFDSDKIQMYGKISGSTNVELVTTQVFRDPSAWYHVVIAIDVTQSTASNRVKFYINGSQVTDFSTETYPAQDTDFPLLSKTNMQVGAHYSSSIGDYYDGYLSEFHFIDGTALTPASFGETNSVTNQWVPIEVTGLTYGNNGFYLPFSSTELANSFTDSSKYAIDSSDRESEITVTSSFTWQFTSSGNTDGEDLVNGVVTNNDAGGGWMPSGDAADRWIKFDFGSGKVYTRCQWISINSSGSEGTWKWQGSNNDSDWSDIGGTFTLGGSDGGSNATYTLGNTLSANTTSYRYYRILGISGTVNTSGRRLAMYFGGYSDGLGHTVTANGAVHSRDQAKIGASSIKFDGSNDSLSLTSSVGNDLIGGSGSWTIEGWVRWTSGSSIFMEQGDYNKRSSQFWVQPDGDIQIYLSNTDGSWDFNQVSGSTLSANTWTHLALVKNGSAITLYKDGARDSVIDGSTTQSTINNSSDTFYIGCFSGSSGFFNGYMDEIRISNSARYTGASFTAPTSAFTADINTTLLIQSDFNGGIGADNSGNKNDFLTTNLVATDQVLDSPTNNFATFFPTNVDPDSDKAISEGNLKSTFNSGSSGTAHSTLAINDGNKWYAEFLVLGTPASGEPVIGIDNNIGWSSGIGYNTSTTNDSIGYVATDGKIYKGGTLVDTESTFTTNDIIQVAFDGSTGRIYFGKNNTWQNSGDPANGTGYVTTAALEAGYIGFACGGHSTGSQAVVANFGQDSSFAGNKTAQGNGGTGEDFYYSPPTGFKALNTDNLSNPEIADPTKHFNTVLYTGNSGSGSNQSVTGVNFSPDFLWIKPRDYTDNHGLIDSIRGGNYNLWSNSTSAEQDNTGGNDAVTLDSDGFTVNQSSNSWNRNGYLFVAWNWLAAAANTSVSAGSIDGTNPTIACTRRTNTTAGFSIVSWEGTGSDGTVAHGLSQAPELIINKSRGDAYNWAVQSFLWNSASDTNMLYLNTTAGTADDTNVFQAAPTSTVFSPQGGAWAGIGTDDINYVAYCFHSVDGYSKIGKYTGNGVEDGSFVYTGFRPAFIFIKRITSSGSNSYIIDSKRIGYNHFVYATDAGSNKYLWPDSTAQEGNGTTAKGIGMDILSNGFKFRTNSSDYQASSNDYLYYAIAESPFKYSNAR